MFGCCYKTCWLYLHGVVVLILVILVTYIANAYHTSVRMLRSYPSSIELESVIPGMKYYKRPSDSENLEFYELNPSGKYHVVLIHGSFQTGGFCRILEPYAEDLDVHLICPTLPGFATTSPYDFIRNTSCVISTFSSDIIALMSHLSVPRFSTVGISLGSEFSYSLAGCASTRGILDAQVSIVGVVYPNQEFAPPSKANPFIHKWIIEPIISQELLARTMVHFLFQVVRSRLVDPETIPELANKPDFVKEVYRSDLKRFGNWTEIGLLVSWTDWVSKKMLAYPLPKYYEKLAQSKVPVRVWWGSNDSIVDYASQEFMMSKIPHAELIEFEGDHNGFDLREIMKDLVSVIEH